MCCSPWGRKESDMTATEQQKVIALQSCVSSAVQQSIQLHVDQLYRCPLPPESPSYRAGPIPPSALWVIPSTKLSSLGFPLAILHMVMYICQSYSPNSSHSPLPTMSTYLLSLYSCPSSRKMVHHLI